MFRIIIGVLTSSPFYP